MGVWTLQANMARGVLTPLAHARVDTEIYVGALAEAENVVISRFGGCIRAPGTEFLGLLKDQTRKARWIRFEFSRAQVFHLEFGHLYIRFWTPAGRVETSPGVAYEIASTYAEADLKYIKFRQSADVVYLVCKGYKTRILKRMSDTNWTLTDFAPQDGPYLKADTKGTRLTPSERGSVVPIMTSNTAPAGTAAATGGGDAYKAFDASVTSAWSYGAPVGATLSYQFPGGTTKIADAYYIRATAAGNGSGTGGGSGPTAWTFEGYDGANWIVLDARTNQNSWGFGETRFFELSNDSAFERYRLNIGGSESSTSVTVAEFGIHEKASAQTPFNLTASNTTGLNDGAGFLTTDVGRSIRLLGSDARWRWAEIVSRVSSTVVTVRLYGHALPDLSAVTLWQLGVFSDTTGWPSSVAIHEDRFTLANTPGDPIAVWMSKSSNYSDFGTSTPLVDDDAVTIRMTGGQLDEVSHLTETKGALMASTATYLRTISPANNGNAIKPDNVRQQAETAVPSSYIDAVAIENVFLFIDFYQQRLYETGYSFDADGFIARELSVVNEHLFLPGIVQLAYASTPHKILYALRTDGKVVAFTYDREQKVAGGTLLDIGGFVEDISVLPGPSRSELWLNVRRTVNGNVVRYAERQAEFWRDGMSLGVPRFGACSYAYEGVAVAGVSGVTFLAGETVGVWADGRDVGDVTITVGGVFTLPNGMTATQFTFGKRVPWKLKTLRLTQHGNRDGSGLGRFAEVQKALLDTFETPAGSFRAGSVDQVDTVNVDDAVEYDPDAPTPYLTKMQPLPVDDSWQNNGVFVIEGESMHPATVRAISLEVDGEP